MMGGFIAGAALMAIAALALLMRPFLGRQPAHTATTHGQMNAIVLRDQLARLDQDLAEGLLQPADHAQSREELQRRALEEIVEPTVALQSGAPRKTMLALGLAIPVAAGGLYAVLGNLGALREAPPAAATHAMQADVERMVASLAEKLEKNPGDGKGWVMLARSYKVMGKTVEAERAYERAGDFIEGNAQELANYADVAASNAKGNFSGKPSVLIQKALKADPQNPMALWLAGTAALYAGDAEGAVRFWERLIGLLPPDSEDVRELKGAISQAKAEAAGKGGRRQ